MKIAYFLDIPYGLGGAGNLLLQQAELMSKLHDIIIIIPCDKNGNGNLEYIKRCYKKGLSYQILYYKTSTNFYDIDYINALECKKSIEEFAVRESIMFFHSVQLNIAVEMVSRKLKIPHLMDIYQLRKEEFLLAYTDIYPHYHLCDSELFANRWSNMLGITSKCIRPVAPLNEIKKKAYFEGGCYKIAMLGAVCERKNQLTAIKAVEKCLRQHHIVLEIAGDIGSYGQMCLNYVQQHNLGNNIHFLGFISDVSRLLEECDCLLCASTDESFPSSIVEAVTYDLTIISTPVAGVPEIFVDKYNAYISKGYCVDEICSAINNCLDDYADGHIAYIKQNARYTWDKYFSPDVVREAMNQYYISILADGKTGDTDVYCSREIEEAKGLYIKENIKFDNVVSMNKKILYYYLLKRKLVKGNAYIWGAGKLGGLAYELVKILELEVDIIAFIDKIKIGQYCGKCIIRPDEIDYDRADYFFISFADNRDSVIDFLCSKGFGFNQKVFLLGI